MPILKLAVVSQAAGDSELNGPAMSKDQVLNNRPLLFGHFVESDAKTNTLVNESDSAGYTFAAAVRQVYF